jgi:hypothetical protein
MRTPASGRLKRQAQVPRRFSSFLAEIYDDAGVLLRASSLQVCLRAHRSRAVDDLVLPHPRTPD